MFAVAVRKESPLRPKNLLLSDSVQGDMLWALLMSCWSYQMKDRPKAAKVVSIVSISNTTIDPFDSNSIECR
jgi:hypothetical protein